MIGPTKQVIVLEYYRSKNEGLNSAALCQNMDCIIVLTDWEMNYKEKSSYANAESRKKAKTKACHVSVHKQNERKVFNQREDLKL